MVSKSEVETPMNPKFINPFTFRLYCQLRDWPDSGAIQSRGLILNCGVPRSGSTKLNQMITQLLHPNYKGNYQYVDNVGSLRKSIVSENENIILKTHTYFPQLKSGIKNGSVKAFMTHRDIRDVAVSIITRGWANDTQELIESGRL